MSENNWYDKFLEELHGDFEEIEDTLFRQDGIEMQRMRPQEEDELEVDYDDEEEEIDLFDDEDVLDDDAMDIEIGEDGDISLTPGQEAEEIRRGNLPDPRDNVLEPERDPIPEGAGQTESMEYNVSADIRDWANVMRGEDEEIPLFDEEEGIEMTEMGESGEVVEFGGQELPGLFEEVDLGEAVESATLGGEIAGETAIEGAAVAGFAEAVSAVAAVAGPVAAVVGAGIAIGTIVDSVVKSNERVDNAKEYVKKLSAIADKTEGHTDTALDYYNKSVKTQNDYTRLYYKYVFGRLDPANFEKNVGTGNDFSTFSYKNEGKNLSKEELTARIASMLNMNPVSLANIFFKTQGLWGEDALDIKKKKILSIYNTLNKTQQFQEFVKNQHMSYRFEGSMHQNISQTLFSNDSRIQRHYEEQSEKDPNYAAFLTQRTQQVNEYLQKNGFKATYSEADVAEGYNPKGPPKFDLVNGYTQVPKVLKVPFWVTYYKMNERKFKNDDLAVIERNDRLWQQNGKRRLFGGAETKTGQQDLEEQQYEDTYGEPHLHNQGDRGFIDYDKIVRRRRRRRPVRPDTPAKPDAPDAPDTPDSPPKPDIPALNPSSDNTPVVPLVDENGDPYNFFYPNPEQENDFDPQKTYKFDLEIARHMAEICQKSYEDTFESFSMYDIIEPIKIDIRIIGYALYSKSHNTIVVCYRGTDFIGADNFYNPFFYPNMVLDILNDIAFLPVEYENIRVHQGFFDYFTRSISQVTNFIEKYSNAGTKLFSSGHSLGANPAAYLSYCWGLKHDKYMGCYNFGSPRGVYDAGDFYQYAPYVYRIADLLDPIAAIPLRSQGLQHIGDCYAIESTDKMARITHLGTSSKADSVFSAGITSVLSGSYHKMENYIRSLRLINQHYRDVNAGSRSVKRMIDDGRSHHEIGLKLNKNASKKVLITAKAKYKHTGSYFKAKPIYEQIDGVPGHFIPNYHKQYGMLMTPVPRTLKDAIIGVYYYKPGEFSGSGAVKGLVVY